MKSEYSVGNFIDTCRFFLQKTNLLTQLRLTKIQHIIEELNSPETIQDLGIEEGSPYGASLNQLGKSIFVICDKKYAKKVCGLIAAHKPTLVLKILKVNSTGPIIKKLD